jgi:hypothetical protein
MKSLLPLAALLIILPLAHGAPTPSPQPAATQTAVVPHMTKDDCKALLKAIKPGMTRDDVARILQPYVPEIIGSSLQGSGHGEIYRLTSKYVLVIWYAGALPGAPRSTEPVMDGNNVHLREEPVKDEELFLKGQIWHLQHPQYLFSDSSYLE